MISHVFNIKQRVLVKEIQRPARVEIIQVDSLGIQYRVCLWEQGKRENVWVYEDELEPLPEVSK
jgi:hypothetical protein